MAEFVKVDAEVTEVSTSKEGEQSAAVAAALIVSNTVTIKGPCGKVITIDQGAPIVPTSKTT